MKALVLVLILIVADFSIATGQSPDSVFYKKGSYGYYEKPVIEDNSFLLEEAFNQQPGIIQYIFVAQSLPSDGQALVYSFTQEMALGNGRHQFSYTLPYQVHHAASPERNFHGFGDLNVHYRYQVWDEADFVMFIPRITLIVPTGNSSQGLGSGAWGTQVNAAFTKRISRSVVTHYNIGLTHFRNGDYYEDDLGKPSLMFERNMLNKHVGAGLVVYPSSWLNILVESVVESECSITHEGKVSRISLATISPGVRFGFTNNHLQVVTGIGMPVYYENFHFRDTGLFFYLSLERAYR